MRAQHSDSDVRRGALGKSREAYMGTTSGFFRSATMYRAEYECSNSFLTFLLCRAGGFFRGL